MAIVTVFIYGIQMLSDIGLGPSIIQNERGEEPVFLNTAWTLQILRGLAIWVVCVLIAWPAAHIYSEPQLMLLIPVVGFSAVISGFDSTARITLNKRLILGRVTLFELISQLIVLCVTVVWAYISPSVWVLVGGSLVGACGRMVLSHFILRDQRNHLAWDGDAAWAILTFGKWIFLSSAIGFLGAQIDRIILPKLITLEILGIYSIAYMLNRVYDDLLTNLSGRVIFPAISRRAYLPRDVLREQVLRNRKPVLWTAALILALMTGFGDRVVLLLYDQRYHDASWMFAILTLGLWPRTLTCTVAPALLAIGQPRYFAYAGFLRFIAVGVGLPIAYGVAGVRGAVVVSSLGCVAEYGVQAYGLHRHGIFTLRQDLKATGIWVILLGSLLICRAAVGMRVPFYSTG